MTVFPTTTLSLADQATREMMREMDETIIRDLNVVAEDDRLDHEGLAEQSIDEEERQRYWAHETNRPFREIYEEERQRAREELQRTQPLSSQPAYTAARISADAYNPIFSPSISATTVIPPDMLLGALSADIVKEDLETWEQVFQQLGQLLAEVRGPEEERALRRIRIRE
jgi:hypothetical protein